MFYDEDELFYEKPKRKRDEITRTPFDRFFFGCGVVIGYALVAFVLFALGVYILRLVL